MKKNTRIWIGTSGFSYDDWVGPVYHKELNKKDRFDFYLTLFNSLELNMTYYKVPSEKVIYSFCKKIQKEFLLTIKAHKSITHERNPEYLGIYNNYLKLIESFGHESLLLLQFPYSFDYNKANFDYLEFLIKRTGFKKAIEFRNISWISEKVINWAKDNGVILVSVDEPALRGLMPRNLLSNLHVYLRFHGRNSDKWWNPDHPYERYDYLYKENELKEWVDKLDSVTPTEVIVYFNNHFRGKSVKNAKMFADLI